MRMHFWLGRKWLPVAVFAFSASLSAGQAQNSPTGTVTGHIYCADTNTPARMANVMLQPVKEVVKEPAKQLTGDAAPVKAPPPFAMEAVSTTMTVTQTALDGSFTLQKVKPGAYYLVVEKQGYVSPIAEFPPEDMEKPTQELADGLVKVLRKVTVEANQTAQVEERIERGAAVSGIISFDDGSPAAGIKVRLLRKNPKGEWQEALRGSSTGYPQIRTTDDQGHFRVAGIRSGIFILQVDLELNETKVARYPGGASSSMSGLKSSLTFFSGSTTRKKDAVPFKLREGEERAGEDIVIPLTKLHRVNGSLVAERDGHVVTGGEISLRYADNKTELTKVDLGREDTSFDFEFVPEGDYTLHVEYPHDPVWNEVDKPGLLAGVYPSIEGKALHVYADKDQPVNVHGDTTGLVVSVPEKTPSPGTATTGASAR